MDAVSHILVERQAGPAGLDRMLGWSAVAHLALLAFVALVPAGWLGARMTSEPENVINFELGGPVGPRAGGMTAMGARPVQQVKPVEAPKTIEPNRPPAAAEPEMIEPMKTVPKKQEAPVKTKMPDAKSRTPTKGEEIRKGTAVADTKSKSQGMGLTSGGGGTGAQLDVGDFCCPEYIVTMQELINRNWSQKQQADATTVMRFTIQRDGTLTDISLFKSSGQPTLDFVSQRALMLTKQLPPLPAEYTQPSLTVRLSFEFHR
jgi:TonB family protein